MSKTHLKGYWMNKNKNVRIPCEINYGYIHRFTVNESKKTVNLNGKWEVTFDEGTINSYKGQALLNQNLSRITGTIRTETGDFKYLEGNISGDSVFLSRFDGAHVMLMEGRTENNRITGVLYSGNSGKSTFYSQFMLFLKPFYSFNSKIRLVIFTIIQMLQLQEKWLSLN
jgi:hypothetical protein